MTTVTEEGFLASEMAGYIDDIAKEKTEIFSIARSLNELAQSLFVNCEGRTDNELAIIMYFVRVLEHFQAIFILEERNVQNAAGALVRVLCEAAIHLVACAKKPDFLDKLIEWDALSQRKLGERILELPKHVDGLSDVERDFIVMKTENAKTAVKQLKNKNREKGAGEENGLPLHIVAEYAGMEYLYNSIYAFYCLSVHTPIRDLNKHVEVDASGRKNINWGPDFKGNLDNLAGACRILMCAMEGFMIAMPSEKISTGLEPLSAALQAHEQKIIDHMNASQSAENPI